MATSEQIKALIKSHVENDEMRFATTALQIAAHEARQGHMGVAEEIKSLVDKAKTKVVKLRPLNNDLNGLVLEVEPTDRLGNLIVSNQVKHRVERILLEYIQKEKLKKHGHAPRRKILLTGPPGTGKTMTAGIFARELQLPYFIIQTDKLVTKFMGETSAKLRLVFEWISERRGVYLFDEFDAIGTERATEGDVGEMRRVLNSFLQMIEQDRSESIIVAATNNLQLLDQALFRRFDDVIHYSLPTKPEAVELIKNRLGKFKGRYDLNKLALRGLSHAEITQACDDAIKYAIIHDSHAVELSVLKKMIDFRKEVYKANK